MQKMQKIMDLFNNFFQKIFNHKIFSLEILGNPIRSYIWASGLLLFLLIGLKILKSKVLNRLKKIAEKTENPIDDLIIDFVEKSIFPLFYLGSFYLAVIQLNLNEGIHKLVTSIVIVVISIQVTRFFLSVAIYFMKNKWFRSGLHTTVSDGIITIVKFLFWMLCATFILDNLGFDISTIIAGLGVGGVAIALASQNILNDLFNYFVIFFDKPFEKGDYIVIGDMSGTVESIGIKTTKIRSLSGEQIICSNTDLSKTRIRNYKRMNKRRVAFNVGITYDTSVEKLKKIPEIVKKLINNVNETEFGRCHFKRFEDFSLNIEIVYYVLNRDYDRFMDVQQEINLKLMEAFSDLGVEFAFPTHTIILSKESV